VRSLLLILMTGVSYFGTSTPTVVAKLASGGYRTSGRHARAHRPEREQGREDALRRRGAVRRGRRRRSALVENYRQDTIARVDPRRFRVTKQIRVGDKPWDVAVGFGSVWSSDAGSGTVSRIDPRKLRVAKRIQLAATVTCIRAGAGAIWVGSQHGDDVYRIDPATNAVTPVHVGNGGEVCVDPHDDGVWVSDNVANSVTRVDPASGRVVATVKVGTAPADGARGPDGLEWIPNQGSSSITRIDPATNAVVDTVPVGPVPFVVRSRVRRHVGRRVQGPPRVAHPALRRGDPLRRSRGTRACARRRTSRQPAVRRPQ